MSDIRKHIEESVSYIRSRVSLQPEIGIILGTGLGGFVNSIHDIVEQIPYGDIPHFPVSTVETHRGVLIFGRHHGKNIVVMQGRFHYYEGYSLKEVTYPVRVLKVLGIKKLLISNAAGGLNPSFNISDLMIITDHINLLPDNPLRGPNYDDFGPRFPDMSCPYDKEMIDIAISICEKNKIPYHLGTYVVVQGPNLETPAEYKFLRTIGGDAVGMSTVPEVIVANHMALPCFAVSVITDIGYPLTRIRKTTLEDVVAAAHKAEPHLITLISEMVRQI